VFWDGADWRLNQEALNCARAVLGPPAAPPDEPPDKTATVLPETTAEQQAALRRCRADHTRWNASQAALGVALTASTPGGVLKDTRPDGAAGWFSISAPLGNAFQVLASLRYSYR